MPSVLRNKAEAGFSLLEILMCLTMMALIMMPFTMAMGAIAKSTRGAYLQSTRTLLLSSLRAETTPTDTAYVWNSTDGSMNTSITDTGQTMGYRRSVDATTANATNSFKRTTLLYLYTNSTDASSAASYKTTAVFYPKVIRQHFGTSTGFIDTLGRYWYGFSFLYNSSYKIPSPVASYGYNDYSGNTFVNVSGNDKLIYAPERAAGTVSYSADVESGAYTVKIYLCETYGGINSTTSRRLLNFYLEGVKMNVDGPYSAYEATGGTNRAQIMMYDVNVTDGTLNFTCSVDSSSDDPNCNLHAIEIIKRTL